VDLPGLGCRRLHSGQAVVTLELLSRFDFLRRRLVGVRFGVCTVCGLVAISTIIVVQGCVGLSPSGKSLGKPAASSTSRLVMLSAGNGRIVFVTLPAASGVRAPGRFSIQAVRPDGRGRVTIFSRNGLVINCPRWSPDGKRVAFSMGPGTGKYANLYTVQADGRGLREVTRGRRHYDYCPAWSPDGRRLAFSSFLPASSAVQPSIWVKNLKTGALTQVTRGSRVHEDNDPAWSPSGRQIVFDRSSATTNFAKARSHLWLVNLATRRLRQLTSGPHQDIDPAWSPHGQRIAFVRSGENTKPQIFTMPATEGRPTQVTKGPKWGVEPTWSPDGRRIAFDSRMRGVSTNIFTVLATGNGLRRVTDNPAYKISMQPDWISE
jgi:Tol biopolymer transport system component